MHSRIPALLITLSLPLTASAAILTVDTSSDSAALAACTAAPADCSLRGAILAANATVALDTIEFDIPMDDAGCNAETGVCRIAVNADFNISQPLLIDGYTQPGAVPNSIPAPGANNAQLKIEITHQPGFNSFRLLDGGGSLSLRGVAMFLPSGGMISGIGRALFDIQGNWFGVTAAGTAPDYSGDGHVLVISVCTATFVRVGGPDPADRNVIAGSGRDANGLPGGGSATVCATSPADDVGLLSVEGNLFGLAPDGITALPMRDALRVLTTSGASNTPDIFILDNRLVRPARNFSGGFGGALRFTVSNVMNHTALIQRNVFGLAVDGTRLGVERDHIFFDSGSSANAHRVLVGGLGEGEGNTFAAAIAQPANSPALGSVALLQNGLVNSRVELVGNTMLGNAGIGLDFPTPTAGGGVAIGRSPNDPGDADSGPNNQQNHPAISAFSVSGGSFDVTYVVDSDPAHTPYPLRIDFYRALGDEGHVLLDSDVYEASDAQTSKSASLTIPPGVPLSPDDVLVAIATDAEGRSSEFSFDTLNLDTDHFPDPNPAGLPFTVQAVATATSGPFKPNGVVRVSIATSPSASCLIELQPTDTPLTSSGSCDLVPTQVGSRLITATYDTLAGAFGSATGGNVIATAQHQVTEPGPEQVGFSQCRADGLEGRDLLIRVLRPSGGVQAVQVDLVHEVGSASPGKDYTAPDAQTLNWAPGDLAPKIIQIPVAADADGEPVENFRLRLQNPINTAILPHALLEVDIIDGEDRGFGDGFEGDCPQ